jgi:hypothetical protein
MGRKANGATITVNEGLYLKQIGDALHCYFRLGGKQFRRSTRTMDVGAAKLKALQWYRDAQRKLDAGEEVECVSFARLKRSYLEQIKGQGKFAYHAPTIERHFLPFFARYDDISKMRKTDVLDYLKFRNAQGEVAPTPQTLNRENTVLRQMLRYAVDRGWLRTAPLID